MQSVVSYGIIYYIENKKEKNQKKSDTRVVLYVAVAVVDWP